MGKKYTDKNGFLHLEGTPISRVQIAPYLGKQIDARGEAGLEPNKIYYVYRSADELFKPETMKSFEGMPFRVGHQMLGKGGRNVKKVDNTPIDGTFLHVRRSDEDPDYLLADIVIYTDRALKAIANGTKELSLGYRCAYVPDEGTHDGEDYQFRQTNIVANHLALVPRGRAGSSVCVQDEAIITDDGLVVTCDSLPEEIQIMEENEKKAKDKLKELLKGSDENVQDCLDYCDLSEEQKKAIKAMKGEKKPDDAEKKPEEVPTEDKACKGCGKDELPAPVPPPAVEEKEEKKEVKKVGGGGEGGETPAPAAEAPAEAPKSEVKEEAKEEVEKVGGGGEGGETPAPAPAEAPAEKPAEAPVEDCKGKGCKAKVQDCKDEACEKGGECKDDKGDGKCDKCAKPMFTQDELDEACKKAAKAARKDALRAKALAEAVGEDAKPDETEVDIARKACAKIKGLEKYAEDGVPDGEVLAAVRGHMAHQADDDGEKVEDAKPKASKKKILTVAQDAAIAKAPSFTAASLKQYLGE